MSPLRNRSHVQKLAEILDLAISPQALASLTSCGRIMIENAARGYGDPRCAWDSSGLALRAPQGTESSCATLLIDIGGTHTKVAIALAESEFRFLFDDPNDSFRTDLSQSAPALQMFLDSLFRRVADTAPALVRSPTPVRVGVIWSNQMTTRPLVTPTLSGITGLVCGLHHGGYRKGEWFLDGLHDGDDLGQQFQQALTSSGINADVLVLGNDTIFTLFAHPGAHAGIVVSSGANCTLVGPGVSGAHTVYNSELGGMLLIPESMLSKGDRIFAARRESASIAVEELCAGAWFRDLCLGHIEALSRLPEGRAILSIQDALVSGSLSCSNASFSALLRDNEDVPTEFTNCDPIAVETLTNLVAALVHRAGAFAAIICYLSISTQIEHGNRAPSIALDSSMARHFAGFYASIELHLKSLMPHDVTHSLHLVEPIKLLGGAEVTVPMIGLARALREYQKPKHTEHPYVST